jgi:hypothetical protein
MLTWLWDRIRSAFNSWVERLILLGAGIVIVALWRNRDDIPDDVTLPTWAFVVVVAVPTVLALLLIARAFRARSGAHVTALQQQLALIAAISTLQGEYKKFLHGPPFLKDTGRSGQEPETIRLDGVRLPAPESIETPLGVGEPCAPDSHTRSLADRGRGEAANACGGTAPG